MAALAALRVCEVVIKLELSQVLLQAAYQQHLRGAQHCLNHDKTVLEEDNDKSAGLSEHY